jgi:hypothetical protein
MSDDTTPDLSLLAWQQRQILTEMGGMRDDLAVLTAIALRQDGTLAALLAEVRDALAAQPTRQPGPRLGDPAVNRKPIARSDPAFPRLTSCSSR